MSQSKAELPVLTIATHRLTEFGPSAEMMHDADPKHEEEDEA